MNMKAANYWERKIRFFLHDPMDKVLKIPGHENRAKKIAEAFGVSAPDKSEVALADIIASGLDRANLPGYSKTDSENGAIDFTADARITHPVSGGDALQFAGDFDSADAVTDQIVNIVGRDTNRLDRIWSKQEYFNYLFFILRKRLISENCGGLGCLWQRLPADSRIPDHSIWNHAGMVSALGSAFNESETRRASMVVFSISPVQSFIGKTRKLRDHWCASVILSWLCFEGIAAVMERLGPDHVVYPSLQDQPLVEAHLGNIFGDLLPKNEPAQETGVASLPNKFVFIAPAGEEAPVVAEIEKRITEKWNALANIVLEFIDGRRGPVKTIFNRQTRCWWRFNWSTAHLVALDDQKDMAALFGENKFAELFQTIGKFSESYPVANIAYPATHTLVQTALAVSKTHPTTAREPESGIKCPVCGELETLHDYAPQGEWSRKAYKSASDAFWKKLSDRFGESTVREDEKLCAVCSIKRFIVLAMKQTTQAHPLQTVFKDGDFPSTTEMATWEYRSELKRKGLLADRETERKLIDELHEKADKYSDDIRQLLEKAKKAQLPKKETDLYYAILMMDGDKMGDLVNGTAIPAVWRDVLHPALVDRYERGTLHSKRRLWEEYLPKRRLLSPGLHAALSESLGAFSLHAVPRIIKSYHGKLVYAGGDDVAAVLPLSTALAAAKGIQRVYNLRFATVSADGVAEDAGNKADNTGRVFLFPGNGKGVSISAAILVCHHKQPLRGALEETHRLLDEVAKKRTGRNAFVVRLKKRSGQSRDFAAKWDEMNIFSENGPYSLLTSFMKIQEAYNKGLLSGSLIYRVPDLAVMFHAILPDGIDISAEEKEKIIRILAYEIEHSGGLQTQYPGKKNKIKRLAKARELAADIAGISIRWDESAHKKGGWKFNGETAVIARYLAKGGNHQ